MKEVLAKLAGIAAAFGAMLLGWALIAFAYWGNQMEGFWDGYIFTLGRARIFLRLAFIAVTLPGTLYLAYLGIIGFNRSVTRRLIRSAALYSAFVLALGCFYVYLRQHLNDGGWPDDTLQAPAWLEWFARRYPSGRY